MIGADHAGAPATATGLRGMRAVGSGRGREGRRAGVRPAASGIWLGDTRRTPVEYVAIKVMRSVTSTPAGRRLRRVIVGTVLVPAMAAAVKVAEKEKVQSKEVGIPIPLCFLRRRRPPREAAVVGEGARVHDARGRGTSQSVHERHRRLPARVAPVLRSEMRSLHLLHRRRRRHRRISTSNDHPRYVDAEKPSITICSCVEHSLALVKS